MVIVQEITIFDYKENDPYIIHHAERIEYSSVLSGGQPDTQRIITVYQKVMNGYS